MDWGTGAAKKRNARNNVRRVGRYINHFDETEGHCIETLSVNSNQVYGAGIDPVVRWGNT